MTVRWFCCRACQVGRRCIGSLPWRPEPSCTGLRRTPCTKNSETVMSYCRTSPTNMECMTTTRLWAGTSQPRSSYTSRPLRPSRFRLGTLRTFRRRAWSRGGMGCRRVDLLLRSRYRRDKPGTSSEQTCSGRTLLHS
jgi:hypothetical protein